MHPGEAGLSAHTSPVSDVTKGAGKPPCFWPGGGQQATQSKVTFALGPRNASACPCGLAGTVWGPGACRGGLGFVVEDTARLPVLRPSTDSASGHTRGGCCRRLPSPSRTRAASWSCPEHVRALSCSPSCGLWLLRCVSCSPVPHLPSLAVGEGRGVLFASGGPRHCPDCFLPRAPMAGLTTPSSTRASCRETRAWAGAGPRPARWA